MPINWYISIFISTIKTCLNLGLRGCLFTHEDVYHKNVICQGSTLYTVHYSLYTVYCSLYTIHCTLYIVHCTLYTVYCTLFTLHCTLYTVHFFLSICPSNFHLHIYSFIFLTFIYLSSCLSISLSAYSTRIIR